MVRLKEILKRMAGPVDLVEQALIIKTIEHIT